MMWYRPSAYDIKVLLRRKSELFTRHCKGIKSIADCLGVKDKVRQSGVLSNESSDNQNISLVGAFCSKKRIYFVNRYIDLKQNNGDSRIWRLLSKVAGPNVLQLILFYLRIRLALRVLYRPKD